MGVRWGSAPTLHEQELCARIFPLFWDFTFQKANFYIFIVGAIILFSILLCYILHPCIYYYSIIIEKLPQNPIYWLRRLCASEHSERALQFFIFHILQTGKKLKKYAHYTVYISYQNLWGPAVFVGPPGQLPTLPSECPLLNPALVLWIIMIMILMHKFAYLVAWNRRFAVISELRISEACRACSSSTHQGACHCMVHWWRFMQSDWKQPSVVDTAWLCLS